MAPTDNFVILGPVDLGNGLSLVAELLDFVPGVEIIDVLHPVDNELDVPLGGQGTELARMIKCQSGEKILLDLSAV